MEGSIPWRAISSLLLCVLVIADNTDPHPHWGKLCPVACSCHLGHFADLPVSQWLHRKQEEKLQPAPPAENEAYTEDDSMKDEGGALLKIAICIFQSSTDPWSLLQQLPADTQALTILQSHSLDKITLEAYHMKHFQQLIFLDIQGYQSEMQTGKKKHQEDNMLILSNDILRPLGLLQYLSLQHIKILSNSLNNNEIDHEGYSMPQVGLNDDNEIPIHVERGRKFRRPFKGPNLVFKAANASDELVPYKIYKEQQERARLSIFVGMTNLILLRVIDSGLHDVYWEMFHGLNKIQHLFFEQNELLFLPEFAFYGTPHLKTLSLAHNKLLNIQSTGLAGLLELQILDLSHNNFSHLSEFSLPPFPNLQAAYLWHNPIETVYASTFEIMNATENIFLGGNISPLELHPNSFQGLICLKNMVLLNVGIEILERELLSGMPQLRYLKMTGVISSISLDAFLDAPMLETLQLQNCNIKSVSMDAFYGLYRLSVLDLSNNLLESLPIGIFDQQFSLKELYLQNNSLKELPEGFFTSLTAKLVRLEGNPWQCSCNMKNWLAAATNRVKEVKSILCEHDKGIGCPSQVTYVYEKKVAPQCHTPEKYKGWSVYHVLRKELRCGKLIHKTFNRKEYLKKKYKEYEKTYKHNDKNSTSSDNNNTTALKYNNLLERSNVIFTQHKNKSINQQQNNTTREQKHEITNAFNNTTINKLNNASTIKIDNTTISIKLFPKKKKYLDNSASPAAIIENTLSTIPQHSKQMKSIPLDVNRLAQLHSNTHLAIPASPENYETILKSKKLAPQEMATAKHVKPLLKDDAKQLKKMWKAEQLRKHQEKLQNYEALS